MASKYDNVRRMMEIAGYGGAEAYNDAASNGQRILKWYGKRYGATLAERKDEAAELTEMFEGMHPFKNGTFNYVMKVVVRNSTASRVETGGVVSTVKDLDKVCIYIDTKKM